MREQGPILELVLNAQRRIRLLEKLDESADEEQTQKQRSNVNGRRSRKSKQPIEETEKKQDSHGHVIFGRTENVKMENVERSIELKVGVI
jgi:hypothetical protein